MSSSTAPWDQPRNATTVTLRFPGARTATEVELLARLREESPRLLEPAIDHVNSRGADQGQEWACCLISWRNTSHSPVTTRDVRVRAAELIERRGWMPTVVKDGAPGPLNVYRALQLAARQLAQPTLRMRALRELREDLGTRSIFEWEAGQRYTQRAGFEPEMVDDGPRSPELVLAVLRAEPATTMRLWRSPSGRLHWLFGCTTAGGPRRLLRVRVTELEFMQRERCRCCPEWTPGREAR